MNRLHPLSAVTYAFQYAFLGLWVPTVAVIGLAAVFDPISATWTGFAAPLGFLGGLAYGIAYYYRFGYEITSDTVDVASGVVARRSREIPYGRIQNVDIRQGVIQRVLDLAIVSIETAGGGESEATLSFVSEDEANRLQTEIRRRTAAVKERRQERHQDRQGAATDAADAERDVPTEEREGPPPERSGAEANAGTADSSPDATPTAPDDAGPAAGTEPAADTETDRDRTGTEHPDRATEAETEADTYPRRKRLFTLELRELLLYSFTSFRPAAGAMAVVIFFFATDRILEFFVATARPVGGPPELGAGDPGSYGILSLVSGLISAVATYCLSVAYTFTTYYDFQLGRVGDDFVYERGLLQRYSGSIPAEKVQSVTITDNPAQRLIDYAGLWVETAGYGPDSNGGSQSAVPMAQRQRVEMFTENLSGVELESLRGPSPIARRRYLVRYSLIAAVVVAVAFGVATVTAFERWYLAAVVFAAVPPAAHLRYTHIGYHVGEDHLIVRSGFWRRRTTVVPYYRIQTVTTRRSIFQRRLELASLVVDTASSRSFVGSSTTIYDIDLEDAREIHETSRKRLQSALRERAAADDVGLSVDFT